MEDTNLIDVEKTQDKIETETEVVKTEESQPVEEVEKSGMDNALNDGDGDESTSDPEASLSLGDLAQRVNALAATVDKLASQIGVAAEKSIESDQEEATITKAEGATDNVDLIKQAVLAAIEPVMERLDRIENEPVDKSYAVLKSKYEDEPFEVRMQREIEAVDGRDAVKRALELAFKGQI